MNKAIVLFAILAAALSFTIEDSKAVAQLESSRWGLQFSDFTGGAVTQAQIDGFTNFANSASSFYKDDVAANLNYIREQMNANFGISSQNFFVAVQTENVRFSWIVWSLGNTIASRQGINRVYPGWSYLWLKFPAPPSGEGYLTIAPGTKGSGIDADVEATIASVVSTYETGDSCTCNDFETQNIGYGMINGSGKKWSTICDATGITWANVWAINGWWVSAKPRNCYYTFYVSEN